MMFGISISVGRYTAQPTAIFLVILLTLSSCAPSMHPDPNIRRLITIANERSRQVADDERNIKREAESARIRFREKQRREPSTRLQDRESAVLNRAQGLLVQERVLLQQILTLERDQRTPRKQAIVRELTLKGMTFQSFEKNAVDQGKQARAWLETAQRRKTADIEIFSHEVAASDRLFALSRQAQVTIGQLLAAMDAPIGYEDPRGFHYGIESVSLEVKD